jgi:hypothetical protein
MPDANEAMSNPPLRPSARIMPGAFSPSSSPRRRSSVAPRRTTSAPDLRSPSSFGTTSASSDEPGSIPSFSSSRSSDLHRERQPHDGHEPHARLAPLPPAHRATRVRPNRSATEPAPVLEPPPQQPPTLESAARTLEEVHRVIRELQRRDRRRGVRGLWVAARAFFGYGPEGSAQRRDMMSLTGKMLFGAGQVRSRRFAIVALLSH